MSEGPSPEQHDSGTNAPGSPSPSEAPTASLKPGDQPLGATAPPERRTCESCGTMLAADQDWCLQCGAGAGSGRTGPGWRSAAAALGAAAVLALGAAAAAYAALKQSSPSPSAPVPAVAQTPPAATTPTSTTTTSTTATDTAGEGLPATSSKPPKIPASTPTPKGGGTSSEAFAEEETEGGTKEGNGSNGDEGKSGGGRTQTERENEEEACNAARSAAEGASSANEEETSTETSTTQTSSAAGESEAEGCSGEEGTSGAKPAPILLEAQAASTYDPNGYPETGFAGPELAIDGTASTAWTAAPAPELVPKVQAGLLLDLEGERQIAKVGLISRTLGMTVRVYGTTQRKTPKAITAAGWKKLSGVHIVEQRSSTITLRRTPEIRQLLVWVLKAPEVEPEVEGEEVDESAAINELELYEPK